VFMIEVRLLGGRATRIGDVVCSHRRGQPVKADSGRSLLPVGPSELRPCPGLRIACWNRRESDRPDLFSQDLRIRGGEIVRRSLDPPSIDDVVDAAMPAVKHRITNSRRRTRHDSVTWIPGIRNEDMTDIVVRTVKRRRIPLRSFNRSDVRFQGIGELFDSGDWMFLPVGMLQLSRRGGGAQSIPARGVLRGAIILTRSQREQWPLRVVRARGPSAWNLRIVALADWLIEGVERHNGGQSEGTPLSVVTRQHLLVHVPEQLTLSISKFLLNATGWVDHVPFAVMLVDPSVFAEIIDCRLLAGTSHGLEAGRRCCRASRRRPHQVGFALEQRRN